MLWGLLATIMWGFLLGLLLRAPLLIGTSIAIVCSLGAAGLAEGWSLIFTFGLILLTLLSLQIAYLLGSASSPKSRHD